MPEHEIVSIGRRVEITEEGTIVNMQVVRFRTAKGQTGEVRFPTSATDEEIRAGVRTEANRLDGLVGPV